MRAVTEEFKLFCPWKDGGGKKDTQKNKKKQKTKGQLYWTKIKTKRNQTNQIKNPT